ncbi:MAG: sugar phosphate isomerase/epimerase [Candidatus Omnitrophica bacterium]|nr:sugar phosphate isomerase/epimerase [Candidatus Omnitrophota bacterium]
MRIAMKLGNSKELESLRDYDGPFRYYELPARFLKKEKELVIELARRGLHFNIHGPSMYSWEMSDQLIEDSRSYLDMCEEVGCKNFILHGLTFQDDRQKINEIMMETLCVIKDHAEIRGIKCLLENGCFFGKTSRKSFEVPSDPEDHANIARTIGLGIVLDLGHAALSARWYGRKMSEFFSSYNMKQCTPEIIHLSDNFLESDDHMAIGEGGSDIDDFQRAMDFWPDSLMTVENFPGEIHKSLKWLAKRAQKDYEMSDIVDLCRLMSWDF